MDNCQAREGGPRWEKGESKEEEDKEVKDKKEAKEKKKACEDTKKMSEVSMEAFQASEMRIQALEKENGELKMREREAKTEERLSKVVMSESNKFGTVLPKNRDDVKKFAMGLDEENEKKFFEIISSMPKSNIFQEIGGSQSTDDVPSKKTKHGEKISEESIQIDIEAKRIVTSEKKYDGSAISYEEALSMAEKNLKK